MAIETNLNVLESEMSSSYMNATLSSVNSNDELAINVAVTPKFPDNIKTQDEIKAYIEDKLKGLSDLGWGIHVQIGPADE